MEKNLLKTYEFNAPIIKPESVDSGYVEFPYDAEKEFGTKGQEKAGDTVHVTIMKDVEPRTVDVPEDFAASLDANPEAKAFYGSLSYTNQKAYATWVAGAKKQETREKRIAEAVAKLGRGERI